MSLLNDALRDLEQRGADDRSAEVPPGLRGGAARKKPRQRALWPVLLGLIVIVAAGGWMGYSLWQSGAPPAETASQAAPASDAPSQKAVAEPKPAAEPDVPEASAKPLTAASPSSDIPEQRFVQAEKAIVPPEPEKETQPVQSPAEPAPTKTAQTAPAQATTRQTAESTGAVTTEPAPVQQPRQEQSAPEPAPEEAAEEVARAPVSPAARDAALAREISAALDRGQLGEAEGLLQAAGPDQAMPESRAVLARYLIQRQAFDRAQRWLPAPVAHDVAELRLLRSRIALAQGDTEAAIEWLASDLPPVADYPGYLATLAALYQRTGQHADAGALWAALLEHDSEVADWWAGLGIALDAQGRTSAARSAYSQAMNLPGLRPALGDYIQQRLTALAN